MTEVKQAEKTAAQHENAKSRAGSKVTVMLKHPHGIIMRLFRMEDVTEPVMGGGVKASKRAVQMGEQVKLNGFARRLGAEAPDFLVVGGYASTPNVDEEFFSEWLRQNADHPLVVNNLIFAQGSENSARDKAKEQKGLKSGLEPLVPDKDERIPKSIKPADKKAA